MTGATLLILGASLVLGVAASYLSEYERRMQEEPALWTRLLAAVLDDGERKEGLS